MQGIARRFSGTCALAVGLFLAGSILAPPNRAQVSSTAATRISTSPTAVWFYVDGEVSVLGGVFNWTTGSKHTLYATPVDSVTQRGVRHTFTNWVVGTQVLTEGNPVTITADPAITAIQGVYATEYALRVAIIDCDEPPCQSPGRVFIGGAPASQSTTVWAAPGSSVVLQASPNPGYVFAGWNNNNRGQVVQGFINTVTMNEPMTVTPIFQPARSFAITTVPENLQIMADRVPVNTPRTLEWGRGSTHVLAPVSPQQGLDGTWWVFASWAHGGTATQSFTVDGTVASGTIVAKYTPALRATLATEPNGLKLKVDGREGTPPYNPIWGVGETHQIEAPAKQTDAQGRVWEFDSWSDGLPAGHSLVVPDVPVDLGMRVVAKYRQLGRVTVTSSLGATIAAVDGTECKTPCTVDRPLGSTVRVTVPAAILLGDSSRAEFDRWSDGTKGVATVTAAAEPKTITASYRTLNRLSVSAEPAEGALCRTAPESADGYYENGAVVQVSLQARPGFRFRRWEGDLSGAATSGNLVMSQPRSVRAHFDKVPYIAPTGVRNAAGQGENASGVAPGSIISIEGSQLAAETVTGPDSPWPQTLAEVTVRTGDRLLPLLFVSPERLTAQLAPDQAEGSAVVVTRSAGQNDVEAQFDVVRNAPGLFATSVDERAITIALHANGSAVSVESPARRGERITILGTGFGPTSPLRPWGFAVPAEVEYRLLDAVTLRIDGKVVPVESATAASGRVGVDAVAFRVPDDAAAGAVLPVSAEVGGRSSNTVFLPIE